VTEGEQFYDLSLTNPLFTDIHEATLPASDDSHHADYDSALLLILRDSLYLQG
jgi:hypothetical protein